MKSKRHAKILEFIQQEEIETQEDILIRLKLSGFDVTQATISRDIKELKLIKKLSSSGKYKYSENKKDVVDMSSKFNSLFLNSVISIDNASNIVVVKCYAGMATAFCATMDSMHWTGLVGTIAGDDTIFALCKNENDAIKIVEELKKVITQ